MNYDAKLSIDQAGAEIGYDPLIDMQAPSRRRRRLIVIAAIVAVLAVAIGLFLHHRSVGSAAPLAVAEQAPAVTVIVPGRTSINGGISTTGTIAARREMPIGSVGEGGEVTRVLVEQGQWVRAGQALAVIDSSVQGEQAAGLAAQVKVSEADARLAQANLDRALKLVDRGFISKADIDRLTATRDAAVATVKVSRAQLGETVAKNRRLTLVAPASGLVLRRNVEAGQVVGAGTGMLFSIARDGQMEMLARLSEDDLAKIGVGAPATVTPVGSATGFSGQVWQLAPTVDVGTRLGLARIALAYAPGLRPGGFATARINAGSMVAPRLPESAVLSDSNGNYVFVVDAHDKVERRAVRTGALNDDGIAVTDGLSGSERVVLRAGAFLDEGETVKPRLVTQ